MLDNVKLFWDFFFYPLYNIDTMGMVSDIVTFALLILIVVRMVMMCFDFSHGKITK